MTADAELEALEQRLAEAVSASDRAAAAELLADDFRLTSALGTGFRLGREDWLDSLAEIETARLDRRDRQSEQFGDTAVVTYRLDLRARLGDDDLSGPYLVTDVWRRSDRWRLAWRNWARLNATFLLEELCAR